MSVVRSVLYQCARIVAHSERWTGIKRQATSANDRNNSLPRQLRKERIDWVIVSTLQYIGSIK